MTVQEQTILLRLGELIGCLQVCIHAAQRAQIITLSANAPAKVLAQLSATEEGLIWARDAVSNHLRQEFGKDVAP